MWELWRRVVGVLGAARARAHLGGVEAELLREAALRGVGAVGDREQRVEGGLGGGEAAAGRDLAPLLAGVLARGGERARVERLLEHVEAERVDAELLCLRRD